jgi:predicted nuclease of predicted toxin-antitoxin system
LRFLVDAQLPPRLANALARAGHEARHVENCGLRTAKDRDIWRYAAEAGAVIVTKDEDFAAMRMSAVDGPAVVWLRVGNIGNERLERILLAALDEIVGAVEAGDMLIEVR